jgi:hypothetical protein
VTDSDDHSNLLFYGVNYGRKKFYDNESDFTEASNYRGLDWNL